MKGTSTSSCHKQKSLPTFCYILLLSTIHAHILYSFFFISQYLPFLYPLFYISMLPLNSCIFALITFLYSCRGSRVFLYGLLRSEYYLTFSEHSVIFLVGIIFCFLAIFSGKYIFYLLNRLLFFATDFMWHLCVDTVLEFFLSLLKDWVVICRRFAMVWEFRMGKSWGWRPGSQPESSLLCYHRDK